MRSAPVSASQETILRDMLDRVVRQVPGCSAAATAVWRGQRPTWRYCSHPDVARLLAEHDMAGAGPHRRTAISLEPTSIGDTLTEVRWPEFCASALRLGIRCLMVGASVWNEHPLSYAVYGLRPHALPQHSIRLVDRLCVDTLESLRQATLLSQVADDVYHLNEAMQTRAVVAQAKGLIMQARGCDPETAFAELQKIAERTRVKISVVAEHLVDGTRRPAAEAEGLLGR